ncbi:gamma-glutamylcyclotransferase [Pseudooceanicola nanhaiensis]|uniref:gamma-glutamylcyclotransferase n=1 Tax=Pseudooceanicola nanhaiensis TaxID=375761 RepID=UPI001CD2D9A2|nr:gamma-glutamylcyclotransferase [Pseudooceanicola nanhaiensis]MCA0922705.1 gamma-glutamylcyclotransferase [Pseudooceanicola nanhaiensis]
MTELSQGGDPFRHHPELARLIRPAAQSFFRTMAPSDLDATMARQGHGPEWRYPDAVREEMRHAVLAGHRGRDLWVFAYGSLMWDPGIEFAEVRQAHVAGHCRKMCLVDRSGGRGDEERPGLMAGLDRGGSCHGLVFRIAAEQVEVESEVVWRREMIAPCYRAVFIPVHTAQGTVEALAFEADNSTDMIETDLCYDLQVRYLATGQGMLGTSMEYVDNLLEHFETLGIDDAALAKLAADARQYRADHPSEVPA